MHLPSYRYTPRYLSGQSAWVRHLPFAYDVVALLKPSLVVELGTWLGDSFFTFCQAIQEERIAASCYAVDHWRGDDQTGPAGFSIFETVQQYCVQNYQSFAYLMRSDFNAAAKEFGVGTIDLLHIDGFHSYESVRADFDTWFPMVREGGVILFHDIKVRSSLDHQNFGVWKLWDALKMKHETREFRHGYGLGVLIKGRPSPQVAEWLEPENFKSLSDYYETRGSEIERNALAKSHEIELETVRRQNHAQITLLNAQKEQLELECAERRIKATQECESLKERFLSLNGKKLKEKGKWKEKERALKKVIKSAEKWQRRSWFTRAFHKWRA